MKPIPKRKASIWQRFLAKLRPTDEQVGEVRVDVTHWIGMAEGFGGQKPEVFFRQAAAAGGLEFHVQRVCHL